MSAYREHFHVELSSLRFLAHDKSMISTLCGPELAAVPVVAVELSDAPTVPRAVAAAATSLALSVTAFFRARVRVMISASRFRR